MAGTIGPPLGEIGLTDLTKSGGAMATLGMTFLPIQLPCTTYTPSQKGSHDVFYAMTIMEFQISIKFCIKLPKFISVERIAPYFFLRINVGITKFWISMEYVLLST